MSSPELSIIVPAHNEEKLLEHTLVALQKAGLECDASFELIVVDDDSSDATSEIAERNGALVESVRLRNIGAVRNAGAAIARGDWLLFVDADTLVPPGTLQAAVTSLRNGAIGGGARVDLNDLSKLPWIKRMMYYFVVVVWQKLGGWAAGCFMFAESSAFREFGGFDEKYFAAEEFFFSRNLKRLGDFVLLREPVVTSSRKLHAYSIWQLARFLIRPIFSLGGMFQSKAGLEILYEDKR